MGYYAVTENSTEGLGDLGRSRRRRKKKSRRRRKQRIAWAAARAAGKITAAQHQALALQQKAARKKSRKRAKKSLRKTIKIIAAGTAAIFAAPLIIKGGKALFGAAKSAIVPTAKSAITLQKLIPPGQPPGGYEPEPFYEEPLEVFPEPAPGWEPVSAAAPAALPVAAPTVAPVELVFTPEGLSRTKLFG